MKKIYLSILAIVATIGLVAGATYALFSNKAISGPNTFATGNADLKIAIDTDKDGIKSNWDDSVTPAFPEKWTNLYPGWEDSYWIYLKNESTSPISLRVFPQLSNAAGDGIMLDNVYLQFLYADGTAVLNSNGNSCGNVTLRWWLDNPDSFDIGDLTQGQERGPWVVQFSIPVTADNSIANKSLNFDLIFNGIQVAP